MCKVQFSMFAKLPLYVGPVWLCMALPGRELLHLSSVVASYYSSLKALFTFNFTRFCPLLSSPNPTPFSNMGITHIVMFQFKPGVPADTVKAVCMHVLKNIKSRAVLRPVAETRDRPALASRP